MNNKLIIGITLGDPVSIGPEITIKALMNEDIYKKCKPLIVGDYSILKKAKEHIKEFENIKINPISNVLDGKYEFGTIDILDLKIISEEKAKELEYGKLSKLAGDASFKYVQKVIQLALDGEIDATVTNAFNKEAINLAGHHYSGHTEIYADLTNTKKYTMLLAHDNLRVVHISTHVSLREACDRVKKDRVLEVIKIANKACKDLGIEKPTIGVAGLNPHSSENGLFGYEEIKEIIPAINLAKEEGICVEGPIPPDTIFSKAKGGWYDIVVAMYHDQGHIPLKVVGFVYDKKEEKWQSISGVNITLGLPIIRASVDHGTAFDQAGKGLASELSLVNAIEYAILLAKGE